MSGAGRLTLLLTFQHVDRNIRNGRHELLIRQGSTLPEFLLSIQRVQMSELCRPSLSLDCVRDCAWMNNYTLVHLDRRQLISIMLDEILDGELTFSRKISGCSL